MLSEKIKSLRCERGLSQEELAKQLSVVRQTVSKWEKGLSVPDSDMLLRIAKELNTTVSQLICEENYNPPDKQNTNKKQKVISTILIILGFPVWFPLVAAAFVILLSIYISIWSIIISLWAVFGALVGCSFGFIAAGIFFAFGISIPTGIAIFAAGIICAGLSIFMFCGCRAVTKGILILTKKIAIWVKGFIIKKEGA